MFASAEAEETTFVLNVALPCTCGSTGCQIHCALASAEAGDFSASSMTTGVTVSFTLAATAAPFGVSTRGRMGSPVSPERSEPHKRSLEVCAPELRAARWSAPTGPHGRALAPRPPHGHTRNTACDGSSESFTRSFSTFGASTVPCIGSHNSANSGGHMAETEISRLRLQSWLAMKRVSIPSFT